jgi:hypothetical protein
MSNPTWSRDAEFRFWYDGKEYLVAWNEQDGEWDLLEVYQDDGAGVDWRDSDDSDSPLLLVTRLVAGDQRFVSAVSTAEVLLLCGKVK